MITDTSFCQSYMITHAQSVPLTGVHASLCVLVGVSASEMDISESVVTNFIANMIITISASNPSTSAATGKQTSHYTL